MVNDEQALIAAVLARPDADLPRLVFADWLQEQGREERAEFIRVQCELAAWRELAKSAHRKAVEAGRRAGKRDLWDTDEGRAFSREFNENEPMNALRRRERELLKLGIEVLNPELSSAPARDFPFVAEEDVEWRRGFVSSITCAAADWLEHGDALYWRPDWTGECPRCYGVGTVFAEDAPLSERCRRCNGTRRIPRPCPPTAQPLTWVRFSGRPTREQQIEMGLEWGGVEQLFYSPCWPGITFELPPEPQTTGWPADQTGTEFRRRAARHMTFPLDPPPPAH